MNFYDFEAIKIDGTKISMSEYKDKVVIVVNTASKCGFTPQFSELQELYNLYKDKGLVILGFPCNQFANQDPGSNDDIKAFCSLNYNVTFDMFQKIDVNGKDAHPLYNYLKNESKGLLGSKIKWNFTKFVIDTKGNVIKRYSPTDKPVKIESKIKDLLSIKG